MRLLALIFLFGFASCYPYGSPKEASDESVLSFLFDMEEAMATPYADEPEGDTKSELEKKMRERINRLIEKIETILEKGGNVNEKLLEKLREIKEKVRDLKDGFMDKAKEIIKKLNEMVKEWLRKQLEKLDLKYTSDVYVEFDDEDNIKTELGKKLKERLDQLLEKMKETIENGKEIKEDMKEKAKKLGEMLKELKIDIGSKTRDLIESVKEKAKGLFKDFLEKLGKKLGITEFSDIYEYDEDLDNDSGKVLQEKLGSRDSRSVKDMFEKIKDYIKDRYQDVKEKFSHFLDWAKEALDKHKDTAKNKIDDIKEVAREFIDHTKRVTKEVAEEAVEFFRPYKDDLGTLWDEVKKTAKEAIGH